MLGEEDTNPSKGAELHDCLCSFFQFRPREFFGNRTIKPLPLAIARKKVAFNPSTGGEIIRFTDKLRYSAGRLDRAVSDIAPDCMRDRQGVVLGKSGSVCVDLGG